LSSGLDGGGAVEFLSYDGQWVSDRMCGYGEIEFRDGITMRAWFQENRPCLDLPCTLLFGEGSRGEEIARKHGGVCAYYVGDVDQFERRWRHGFGVMCFPDGTRFYGGWERNQRHGVGMLLRPDGVTYWGQWQGNRIEGKGKLIFPGWHTLLCERTSTTGGDTGGGTTPLQLHMRDATLRLSEQLSAKETHKKEVARRFGKFQVLLSAVLESSPRKPNEVCVELEGMLLRATKQQSQSAQHTRQALLSLLKGENHRTGALLCRFALVFRALYTANGSVRARLAGATADDPYGLLFDTTHGERDLEYALDDLTSILETVARSAATLLYTKVKIAPAAVFSAAREVLIPQVCAVWLLVFVDWFVDLGRSDCCCCCW
jgi:MORN repeat